MNKRLRPIIIAGLGILLAFTIAALTYSTPPAMGNSFGAAAVFLQPTSTPQPKDLSEIGSTDAIVIMGFLIALIVIIPIMVRRKAWREGRR